MFSESAFPQYRAGWCLERTHPTSVPGMFILLLLWCINTLRIAGTDTPLQWARQAEPSFHPIFTSQQNALAVFLTDAPIVRIKNSEHKLELFRNTQVVDISKLSLASHNLKRSVSLLNKQELIFKSSFHTCTDCAVELLLVEQVGYHECFSRCQIHGAEMFSDFQHLRDILAVFGDNHNLDVSKIWIQTNQTEKKEGRYSAKYALGVQVNKTRVSLLPENQITQLGSVNCLSFYIKDWISDDCQSIGAKTSYWQKTIKNGKYYPQQFYKLNVQLVLDDSFILNRETGRTNITSNFDWQVLHANWRILVPVSQDIKLTALQKATCICTRSKDITHSRRLKAKSMLSEIDLNNRDLFFGIEQQRVKKESSFDLSSVPVLLNDLQNIKIRPPVGYFLDPSMIFPLSINSSDSALIFKSKLNNTLGTLLSQVGHNDNRQKRAMPGILLGSLKILSLGVPYLLEDSWAVMKDLMKEFKAKTIVPQFTQQNQMSSAAFAHLLSEHFTDDIKFSVLNDRIAVDIKGNQDFLFNMSSKLDERLLAEYSASSEKLVYFQEKILDILPQLLLRRLMPEIEAKLRPNGEILYHLTLSKSFIVCDFFWEQIVPNSRVTSYRFWSLPANQIEQKFETIDVKNLTISLDNKLDLSAKTNDIFDCQQRLLTSVALPVANYCPNREVEVMQAHIGLLWANASILLAQGPSTLHYSCSEGTNKVLQLKMQFHLFIIHDLCTVHIQFPDGLAFNKPMENIRQERNFGLIHVLQYNILQATPRYEITKLWLITLSICLSVLAVVLLGALIYFCYYKTKIGIRLWRIVSGEEELPAETRIEFVDRRSRERTSSFERDSSISPSKQLPTRGGQQGERLLNQAFQNHNIRGNSCERCTQVSDKGCELRIPDLQVLPECNRTVDFVFPHMYSASMDSGVPSGSFRTNLSSLQIPISKPKFDNTGEISYDSNPKMPSTIPASHFY